MLPVLAIALTLDSLLSLLIGLVIVAIVIYGVVLVLGMLKLPEPITRLVYLILAVIGLILLLDLLGFVH